MRMSETERAVADAARNLITKVYARLLEAYPDGNFREQSGYYKVELGELIHILEDISRAKIRFGNNLIRLTYPDNRFHGVLEDMVNFFFNFLINGHPDGSEDWSAGENRERRKAEIDRYQTDSRLKFEYLAIHEMVSTFIKRQPPGFERAYYF